MHAEPATEHVLRERALVAQTPGDRGMFLALAPMDGVTDWELKRYFEII